MNIMRQVLTDGKHLDSLADNVDEANTVEMEDILVRLEDWLQTLERLIGQFTQDDLSYQSLGDLLGR